MSLNNTNSLDSKNNISNSLKNFKKERKNNNTDNTISSKKKIDTENRKKDLNKLLSFANSLY